MLTPPGHRTTRDRAVPEGSLNVRIDAVPLTGRLHIRDDSQRMGGAELDSPEPEEKAAARAMRRTVLP